MPNILLAHSDPLRVILFQKRGIICGNCEHLANTYKGAVEEIGCCTAWGRNFKVAVNKPPFPVEVDIDYPEQNYCGKFKRR